MRTLTDLAVPNECREISTYQYENESKVCAIFSIF